jgi:histidinol-phosphate aminotransferase
MSILDLARPELRAFKPYSSARLEAGSEGVLLNANEWPWPPFEGAAALNRYPPPQPPALLTRLAQIYGWPAEGVLIGRGSDEAIDLLVRGFCRAGQDSVLICPPTFGMYRVAAQLQGAAVVSVPLLVDDDFAIDVDSVLAAVEVNRPKLVFLCSPNNPTGQQADRGELLRLIDALADQALVIVDEAYVEFAQEPSLVAELAKRPHLAILRTLSKAYGLAAARIGCLLGAPDLISFLRGLMAPYPLPQPCVAVALQALDPAQDALRAERMAQLLRERERLAVALRASHEIKQVWPSDANFLCFRCHDAGALLKRCAEAGLILRDVSHYLGLAGCLRVSVGTGEENRRLIAVLRGALGASLRADTDQSGVGSRESEFEVDRGS